MVGSYGRHLNRFKALHNSTRTVALRQGAPSNALQQKGDIRFCKNFDNHSSDKTHIQT